MRSDKDVGQARPRANQRHAQMPRPGQLKWPIGQFRRDPDDAPCMVVFIQLAQVDGAEPETGLCHDLLEQLPIAFHKRGTQNFVARYDGLECLFDGLSVTRAVPNAQQCSATPG